VKDVTLTAPAELVDAIAERVLELLDARGALDRDEWVDVAGAAEHLCCKPQRVYDLVSQSKLIPSRDGTRLLFRRSHLDAYLERGGRE